jgi:hypothetical protein
VWLAQPYLELVLYATALRLDLCAYHGGGGWRYPFAFKKNPFLARFGLSAWGLFARAARAHTGGEARPLSRIRYEGGSFKCHLWPGAVFNFN